MSYCVHCGVELGDDQKRCPLCGTPVLDPGRLSEEDIRTFFPTRQVRVEPVSKGGIAMLLTSMLVSVSLCCGLLNLVLKPGTAWSLFVLGAAMMLWVWTVFPLLARWAPAWLKLGLDVAAVALYVWIIALTLDGMTWFLGLAVPMLLGGAVILGIAGAIFRKKRSMLSTITVILAAVGLVCVDIELCCDLYLRGAVDMGWSLVVFACCFGVCIPLIVIRRVPSLREEARRRFHL